MTSVSQQPEQEHAPSAEQQAMLDRGASSTALIAAAGSGKTRVLTWLYRDAAVRDQVPLTALLAISFTDKASGELRSRIAEKLREAQPESPPDISQAWIGTFHSTCIRILREFAHHCRIDPAFTVIDSLSAELLRAEAWERAVSDVIGPPGSPESRLLSRLGEHRVRPALLKWWEARRSAGEVHPVLPRPAPGFDAVMSAIDQLEDAGIALASEVESVLAERGGKSVATLDNAAEAARCTIEVAARLREEARSGARGPDTHERFAASCREQLEAIPGARAARPLDGERAAIVKQVTTEAPAGLVRALDELCAGPVVDLLARLIEGFSRAYDAAKAASEQLDFDDLELKTLELLRNNRFVREQLVRRFERIYVDEFQDTNPRQFELVQLLAGGRAWSQQAGDDGPAVIVVGDPRQAIYGFRHADVTLISDAEEALPPSGRLRLSANYRSHKDILDVVDAAFTTLDPEHAPVASGRTPAGSLDSGEPRVELLITHEVHADSWSEADLGTPEGVNANAALAEMRLVAHRIRQLRDEHQSDEQQPAIAVLARTRAGLTKMAAALADLGVPTQRDAADGFWQRLEVIDVLAWLRLVRTDADDQAFVQVFSGPLAGLSTDGVVGIGLERRHRHSDPDVARTRRARVAQACAEGRTFTPDDRSRIEGLLALLEAQRAIGRAADPAGLIDELLRITGYDEHVAALDGGARGIANLMRLRRIAAETAAQGDSLTDLLDRIDAEQQAGLDTPEGATAGGDAVRLMTIHGAKGLEFHTVFVIGTASVGQSGSPAILGDGDRIGLNLALRPGAETSPLFDHELLVARAHAREIEEIRRLLYVAVTRAEDRLVVSGVVKTNAAGELQLCHPEAMRSAETRGGSGIKPTTPPINWFAPALVPELARLMSDGVVSAVSEAGVKVVVSTPGADALPEHARRPPVRELPVHRLEPVAVDELQEPAAVALAAPGRFSYSALSLHQACALRFHAQQILGLPAAPDPLPSGRGVASTPRGLRAAEVGTLVHAVLEVLELPPDGPGRAREVTAAVGSRLGLDPDSNHESGRRVHEMIAAACEAPVLRELWRGGAPERELPFTVGLGDGGSLLTGVVDAWKWLEDGSVLVVDYKTDNVSGSDLDEHTEARYRMQRLAYALAALQAGAPRVHVVHIFLSVPGAPVAAAEFGQQDSERITAELLGVAASIGTCLDPAPARAPHRYLCEGCPVRGGWCGWTSEATMRYPSDPLPVAADWSQDSARFPAG